MHDRLAGIQLAQSFAQIDREKLAFRAVTQSHYEQSVRAVRARNAFFPAVAMLGFLSNIVMLGMGVWFIWRGEFTVGGLIAYRGYWWRLQSPISTLARMTDILQRAKAAARRVIEVLDTPVEIANISGAVSLQVRTGEIEFRDVAFRYGSGPLILDGVSFRVAPGEVVAIAGNERSWKDNLSQLGRKIFRSDRWENSRGWPRHSPRNAGFSSRCHRDGPAGNISL